jgi:hypothetical protein
MALDAVLGEASGKIAAIGDSQVANLRYLYKQGAIYLEAK